MMDLTVNEARPLKRKKESDDEASDENNPSVTKSARLTTEPDEDNCLPSSSSADNCSTSEPVIVSFDIPIDLSSSSPYKSHSQIKIASIDARENPVDLSCNTPDKNKDEFPVDLSKSWSISGEVTSDVSQDVESTTKPSDDCNEDNGTTSQNASGNIIDNESDHHISLVLESSESSVEDVCAIENAKSDPQTTETLSLSYQECNTNDTSKTNLDEGPSKCKESRKIACNDTNVAQNDERDTERVEASCKKDDRGNKENTEGSLESLKPDEISVELELGKGDEKEVNKNSELIKSSDEVIVITDPESSISELETPGVSRNLTEKPPLSLTDEERDRFEFISQQLQILNTDNESKSQPKTKGDKKRAQKTTSQRNKHRLAAVKRALKSPRKAGTSRSSKRGSKQNVRRLNDFGSGEESDSDDSDELKIRDTEDEFDNELDERLEENAAKNNLTAINVKSILHHVVTNEFVLDMIQNSVSDEGLKPAAYEPKMTRSKTKQGNVPEVFPWLSSPVKSSHGKPTILDVNFPDEEEDDDYDPTKETMHFEPNDSDADSVLSSWLSDFGSPCPATPTTPCPPSSLPSKEKSQTSNRDSESETFQSPMNPPSVPQPHSAARQLGKKYQEALYKINKEDDDPENVAHRTRSKVPLNDKSILELEASFVAPDITADMYDLQDPDSDDPDYSSFLTGLIEPPSCPEVRSQREQTDDEMNDPEYNYLAEYEEPDAEDFRNDRGTRITKKELNALFEELLEAYGDGDEEPGIQKPAGVQMKTRTFQPAEPSQPENIQLTPEQLSQIKDQMTKHVQLLSQVYVLSSENHQNPVKLLLTDLERLGKCMNCGSKSYFNPPNLVSALHLIREPLPPHLFTCQSVKKSKSKTMTDDGETEKAEDSSLKSKNTKRKRRLMAAAELTSELKELFWTNLAFRYPQLLPNSMLYPDVIAEKQKVVFTEAEDNLIALGLSEMTEPGFKRNQLIRDHLLPTKTAKQIHIRIKNQMAKKESNPIKVYLKKRILPDFPHTSHINGKHMDYPKWYKEKVKHLKSVQRPRSYSIGSSVNIEKELSSLKLCPEVKKVKSNPVTPKLLPLTAEKFVKVKPLSKAIQKALDFGVDRNRLDKDQNTPMPYTFVKFDENKFVSSERRIQLSDVKLGTTRFPVAFLCPTSLNVGPIPASNLCETPPQFPINAPIIIRPCNIRMSPVPNLTANVPVIKTSAITCVAPSVLISQVSSVNSSTCHTTTTTMSQGIITSSTHSKMYPINQAGVGSPNRITVAYQGSPTCKLSQSELNLRVQPKSGMEAISSVATILTPQKTNVADGNASKTSQENSPFKFLKTPTKQGKVFRKLVPSPAKSPTKRLILPYIRKKFTVISPKKKRLQSQTKPIQPKNYILKAEKISPVKKAASRVKAKRVYNTRTPRCLLPKLTNSGSVISVTMEELQGAKVCEGINQTESISEDISGKDHVVEDNESIAESVTAGAKDSDTCLTNTESLSVREQPMVTPPDSADSQTEEEEDITHLQELMEASTTIRSSVLTKKKQGSKDRRSKAQKHKDSTLALLDPDIVQADPIRDDRDIAFAQSYLQNVHTALQDSPKVYGEFLQLLTEFGKSQRTPVELYEDIKKVLSEYPDLVEDFAGFLLPEQAVKCGCYRANRHYHKVRSFLRKLEIHFEKQPSHFQKIMKAFCQGGKTAHELQSMLQPLLKGQQHLLEEFSLFFDNERPPESHMRDYEEIDMGESDLEEECYLDGFEEVIWSEETDHNGTNLCQCDCHDNKSDVTFYKRRKHCQTCGLKIVGGKLYFRSTGNNLIPAKVIYHKSFYMDETRGTPDSVQSAVQDQIDTALSTVDKVGEKEEKGDGEPSEEGSNREKNVTCLIRKRIKPITLVRSNHPGGRFITLDEMDESGMRSNPWVMKTEQENNSPHTISMLDNPMGNLQTPPIGRLFNQPSNDNMENKGEEKSPLLTMDPPTSDSAVIVVSDTLPEEILQPPIKPTPVIPSPSKDSNSSASQDILAKAMKVAKLSASDCELSLDYSQHAKFTYSATNQLEGDQMDDKSKQQTQSSSEVQITPPSDQENSPGEKTG